MGSIDIPRKLAVEGKQYVLHIASAGKEGAFTLTYEHQPIDEESFLLASYGVNFESAVNKMQQLLKEEGLISEIL